VLAAADLGLPVDSQTDIPWRYIGDRCGPVGERAAAANELPFRRLNTPAQATLACTWRTARPSRVLARRGSLNPGHSGQARPGPVCARRSRSRAVTDTAPTELSKSVRFQ
jgi:hypothetical protein